jgi:hypothetical protein
VQSVLQEGHGVLDDELLTALHEATEAVLTHVLAQTDLTLEQVQARLKQKS